MPPDRIFKFLASYVKLFLTFTLMFSISNVELKLAIVMYVDIQIYLSVSQRNRTSRGRRVMSTYLSPLPFLSGMIPIPSMLKRLTLQILLSFLSEVVCRSCCSRWSVKTGGSRSLDLQVMTFRHVLWSAAWEHFEPLWDLLRWISWSSLPPQNLECFCIGRNSLLYCTAMSWYM